MWHLGIIVSLRLFKCNLHWP